MSGGDDGLSSRAFQKLLCAAVGLVLAFSTPASASVLTITPLDLDASGFYSCTDCGGFPSSVVTVNATSNTLDLMATLRGANSSGTFQLTGFSFPFIRADVSLFEAATGPGAVFMDFLLLSGGRPVFGVQVASSGTTSTLGGHNHVLWGPEAEMVLEMEHPYDYPTFITSSFVHFTATYHTQGDFPTTGGGGGGDNPPPPPEAVPAPASLPLFLTGLGVMGWFARRKKRKLLVYAGIA